MAIFWTVGACLLLAAWRSGVAEDRARHAPTCPEGQAFTPAECQITFDGTMTGLTHDRAEMDVGGRRATAKVTLSGEISDVRGVPVRVTLYQGKVIHIEGQRLKIDTGDAPATNHTNLRNFGMFCIVGGAALAGANLLLGSGRRRRAAAR
ncbi:hypothetical protein ACPPVO_24135 [Dactylosporangium sp. McL0621]|uniref:hypothetical protein n=1 Tax=Dactylosporangium sp. McL0621 TaxID=3415678 RepID=UPI003CEDAF3E